MKTEFAQRWRDRRTTFRHRAADFVPGLYEVAAIFSDKIAGGFVRRHHYSGTYPAARERFGLYRGDLLVGVAIFSVPCHPAVITNWFPFSDWKLGLELGRFVLLDLVEFNAESWFFARCRELLKRIGYQGVVAFADDQARYADDGRTVFPGHVGTIYQASNGVLAGRSKRQSAYLLPSGRIWHRRNRGKIINGHSGAQYAIDQLLEAGAPPFRPADPAGWLEESLSLVTRPLQHPGNLRYLWGLERAVTRSLPTSDPYPKIGDVQ